MIYLKYLRYLVLHKWYVMVECFSFGLYWRGLVHDMSKFLPSEFIPYARYFYGVCSICGNKGRVWNNSVGDGWMPCPKCSKDGNKAGYFKPAVTGDSNFDFAWLLHQKRNRHHWQWWLLYEDCGNVKTMPMSGEDIVEMVCDWVGAGKAQGKFSPADDRYCEVRKWYAENRSKIILDSFTRTLVEMVIGK